MTPEEIQQQKDIEFYAASVNAWFNTSLERDKSLFTLSAGGIGLLITLLTTIGISSSFLLHLYIATILCFLVSLLTVLFVFQHNKTHLEQILSAKGTASDSFLKLLDLVTITAFWVGVTLASLIGISAAINSFEIKGKTMATEISKKATTPNMAYDSFAGVKNLQPQPVTPAPAPTPSASAPAAPSANSSSSPQGSGS